jgi:hypothetical protein
MGRSQFREAERGGSRKGTSFIHSDGWSVWTSFVEDRGKDPVRCPEADPTGGVSGPAVTVRPPAGPDEGTGSGGAEVDLDHIGPERSRNGDPKRRRS